MYNISKFIDKYFNDYQIVSSGKEIAIECIFCSQSSKKKKLTINTESGLWHCWKCGKKGNFFQFIDKVKKQGKSVNLDAFKQEGEKFKNTEIKPIVDEIPYPEGFFLLDPKAKGYTVEQALDYLKGRGIEGNTIHAYRLGYCGTGMLSGRVIVPIYYKDKLVSYIARDFTGKSSRRILTPPGNGTAGIKRYIYRIEEAKKLGHLIITEGVFSCISVGPCGVAIFGKQPTVNQLAQILNAKPKRVTVALDPDAAKEAISLANSLLFHIKDVRLAEFPVGEDPNSLSKEALEDCLRNARRVNMFNPIEEM